MSMEFTQTTYAGDVQILKRKPFEGIAITLDFTNVATGIVKAGSPIDADGEVANDETAIGILLHDVTSARPQGTILKKAYINTAVAEAHCGLTYDDDVKTALPMVIFE